MYKIAHFNHGPFGDQILLTNDLGRFLFLSEDIFHRFLDHSLSADTKEYDLLEENGFLYLSEDQFVHAFADDMNAMKRCLLTSTQLFIIVLTDACNQCCVYCQAGKNHHTNTPIEVCKKAVDIAAQSPVGQVTIEFQGGEPTLNPEALRFTIPYAESVFARLGKRVEFSIVTNFTNCDPALLEWLIAKDAHISTSLDGHKFLHDRNRPLSSRESSYDAWHRGAKTYQSLCLAHGKPARINAIQTTTRASLPYPHEILEEYLANGMNSLYIRPLTPLGFAAERWSAIGYTPAEYLDFYFSLFDEILQRNVQGEDIFEMTASLYLARILGNTSVSHTEYRSPCGAGVGQMAINYDGNVYTCDEGRMLANMGDPIFRMGSVENTYKELIQSPVTHAMCAASCVESLPFCSSCVFAPYCGVCPVVNYGLEGDLISHDANSYHCQIAKGIITHLFEIIRRGDPQELEVLYKLANNG